MLITHKKLQPVQCYHIFSNSMVVYLAKNHYGSYSPQMVPTNPPGSWPMLILLDEELRLGLQCVFELMNYD